MMAIFASPYGDIALSEKSITQQVFGGLKDRPDAIVMTDGITGETLSAAQMMDRVKRLAGGLTEQGFGAGTTVALMAPNMPDYAVALHGVAWAGGTVTPINPSCTAHEVRHQLMDAAPT
jgi:acyl-CoA synthetase (AMP-forming)/AMP-acid ligase II